MNRPRPAGKIGGVRRLRVFLAIAVLAAGLSSIGGGSPAALAHSRPQGVVLRVMTFNMAGGEWGWEHGPGSRQTAADEQAVVAAIRAARADVVGLQEPFGRTRLIARVLGPSWHAYPRLHTVSRYPILEPGGARFSERLRARPGLTSTCSGTSGAGTAGPAGVFHRRAAAQPALGMRRGDGLPAHPGGTMLLAPAGRSRGGAIVVPRL